MAVCSMKKLSVITCTTDSEKLIRSLMFLKCAEVRRADGEIPEGFRAVSTEEERMRLEQTLAGVKTAEELLAQYGKQKRGLFAVKKSVPASVLLGSEEETEAAAAVKDACAVSDGLAELRAEENRALSLRAALSPWQSYELPLGKTGTQKTQIILGTLPPVTDAAKLEDKLSEEASALLEIVSRDAAGIYVSVICCAEDEEMTSRILSGAGFVKATFKDLSGTAAEEDAKLSVTFDRIAAARAILVETAASLAEKLPVVEQYSDILRTRLQLCGAKEKALQSESVTMLEAWVPENRVDAVTAELERIGSAYEFSDPSPEDTVPVLLENNALAAPFEPVVGLYSLPAYKTFDPTFIMALFYIPIFGLMFADIGYGLVLTGLCLLALKLLHVAGTLKKFLQMFAICGVSSMACGVLFGGYFGDAPTALMQNFFGVQDLPDLALWFNPMNDPMTFLLVSLALGAVHLLVGMGIKFWILARAGKWFEAIFDIGSWFVLFIGIGVYAVVGKAGLIVIAAGVLMIVATAGRAEKNPIMKFLKGLLGLYDLINYASDLLSYARILSLSLASAVIASVINIVGTMMGPSLVGVIVFIVAALLGHTLNIAINVLGTFVHTSRLQYIEFFGKFFEDGGVPFQPLDAETQYIAYDTSAYFNS